MKYYYKTETNIDFVWRIREIKNDPYRKGETTAEHFVNNVKRYENSILNTEEDLRNKNLLDNYHEARLDMFDDNGVKMDEVIGLLHKNEQFSTIFAYRYLNYFNKIVPIEFPDELETQSVRSIFNKIVFLEKEEYDKIIETCFSYFKSLCNIDPYYSETKLDTIEKFLPTIDLNCIAISEDLDSQEVVYYFRPSWDEEHGLYISYNFNTLSCKTKY